MSRLGYNLQHTHTAAFTLYEYEEAGREIEVHGTSANHSVSRRRMTRLIFLSCVFAMVCPRNPVPGHARVRATQCLKLVYVKLPLYIECLPHFVACSTPPT